MNNSGRFWKLLEEQTIPAGMRGINAGAHQACWGKPCRSRARSCCSWVWFSVQICGCVSICKGIVLSRSFCRSSRETKFLPFGLCVTWANKTRFYNYILFLIFRAFGKSLSAGGVKEFSSPPPFLVFPLTCLEWNT